jgi:PKD repeat protein
MADESGYQDEIEWIVEIENSISLPYPFCDVNYGYAPLTVAFDASGSSSAVGGELSYRWDFDNGDESTSVAPVCVFQAGEYDVKALRQGQGRKQQVGNSPVPNPAGARAVP